MSTRESRSAMNRAVGTTFSALDSVEYQQIEEAVYSYERDRAKAGARRLDAYVPASDALRRLTLLELVRVDVELAVAEGRAVELADYARRYPELGDAEALAKELEWDPISQASWPWSDGWERVGGEIRVRERTIEAGRRVGDYHLVRLLGEGTFGQVFLAVQESLERVVAVKVTRGGDREARTLARLDHEHIVRVYGETVLPDERLRLIAMQYVPGASLRDVLEVLHGGEREESVLSIARGAADAVCSRYGGDGELPAGQRRRGVDRERMVCEVGAKLADALAHAHREGVLHRDIKPENILIDAEGKPYLTDFNLSEIRGRCGHGAEESSVGGTLRYMSPEHLTAFATRSDRAAAKVDARSDVYALGLVLYELATGELPYDDPTSDDSIEAVAMRMATVRRQPSRRLQRTTGRIGRTLLDVLSRCAHPDAAERYESAEELAAALESASQVVETEAKLRTFRRGDMSVVMVMGGILLPHMLGVMANMNYANAQYAAALSTDAARWLASVQIGYAMVAFSAAVGGTFWLLRPALDAAETLPPRRVRMKIRRRIVRLPTAGWLLAAVAWLPAIVLQQLVFQLYADAFSLEVVRYCTLAFVISAAAAVTFSHFVAERFCVVELYPPLLVGSTHPLEAARSELAPVERRVTAFQLIAGVVPLAGLAAVLAWMPGGDDGVHGMRSFAMVLIGLSGLGFAAAMWFAREIRRVVGLLSGRSV